MRMAKSSVNYETTSHGMYKTISGNLLRLPLMVLSKHYNYFFTLSTIALKAAGLFKARSARTLRLISIPAL